MRIICQVKLLTDVRFHSCLQERVEYPGLSFRYPLEPSVTVIRPLKAGHRYVFHRQVIRLDCRNSARRESDDYHARAPRHGAQRRSVRPSSDRIGHQVDAVPIGNLSNSITQTIAKIVHGKVDDGVGAGTFFRCDACCAAHTDDDCLHFRYSSLCAPSADAPTPLSP